MVSHVIASIDLDLHLSHYQEAYDRIFSMTLNRPAACAAYFLDVLIATAQLHLDYWQLRKHCLAPSGSRANTRRSKSRGATRIPTDIDEEAIREKLKDRLTALPLWAEFDPNNFFADENRLYAPEDYIRELALHLPEIYAEASKARKCRTSASVQDGLTAGCEQMHRIEHIAHHASYCRFALEIMSQENAWRKSSAPGPRL